MLSLVSTRSFVALRFIGSRFNDCPEAESLVSFCIRLGSAGVRDAAPSCQKKKNQNSIY
jgi:hypothetical protein